MIDLKFVTNRYEDVINVRAYEASSLFGEMGGYIGVFLGFSILDWLYGIIKMLAGLNKRRGNRTLMSFLQDFP